MKLPNKQHTDLSSFLEAYFLGLETAYKSIDQNLLEKIAHILTDIILERKTIYTCGNGGSTAISEHFIADFLIISLKFINLFIMDSSISLFKRCRLFNPTSG